MRLIITTFIAAMLASCSRNPEPLAGAAVQVGEGKELILNLDPGSAVQIRQARPDGRIALVANLNGNLEIVQLERGGATPRGLKLVSTDKAEFNVVTGSGDSVVLIVDEDGDGLPDTKIEGKKKYRRAKIEWEEVPRQKKAE
jgi:hypothetical protein